MQFVLNGVPFVTALSSRSGSESSSLVGDFWGGLASMLVALPSSIAFGVLTFTVLGPEFAGAGALAGILGAAALGLVAPLIGRTKGLISTPCAPSAAVLSAAVAALAAGRVGTGLTPETIIPLVAIIGLASGALQILYGAIGGGRLIKFIPFPVVSGYLSGVGVLIALGQLPRLFGLPENTPLMSGLVSPGLWQWQALVVGITTIVLMVTAPKITRKIPAAIIGLAGGIAVYFLLGFVSPGMLHIEGNPLIIGPIESSGSIFSSMGHHIASLFSVQASTLELVLIPALTLSVLLSIDTLKTCVGLDALIHTRHNSDRTLVGQGLGNIAASFIGGMPGAGAMGPTLVNVASGGKTFRAGVIEALFVIIAFAMLGKLIAWVPIGALAGILLVIAWRMFDKNMFRLLKSASGRFDFAVIACVILVAVTVDLIAASGVGVGLAILLFIRDQIRGTVIRRKLYLNQTSSKTFRTPAEREILSRNGTLGLFCELQGNLFFGTTDQLYSQLEPDLRTSKYILLDMRRVQSMDYTAAHLFEQMHSQLAHRGGQLLFSGMPSGLLDERNFELYLQQLGVVRKGGGVMISETLDGALEWIENQILDAANVTTVEDAKLLDVKDFELFRGFDEQVIRTLNSCVQERKVGAGEQIFSQGDEEDELYLVRKGSVRVMLPLEKGKHHHLATIGRGSFFGELAFLDRGVRSADAFAKDPTDLYKLSRSRLNELSRSDPDVGAQIFARLAHAIAIRLRQTDAELRALEER